MRLITEKREFTRIQLHFPVQWQRLSVEEHEQWKPMVLRQSTHDRRKFFFRSTDIPNFPRDTARPAEIAILQSLQQLHQKVDRLFELLYPQQMDAHRISGDAVDLSASGVRFLTDIEVKRGEFLLLSFTLPGKSQTMAARRSPWIKQSNMIESLAEVVNISRADKRWTVAVTFSAIHPTDQQEIQRYCQQHRKK